MGDGEPKRKETYSVDATGCMQAMNTATGVNVTLYNDDTDQMVAGWFQPGERWDAEAGEFVAIGEQIHLGFAREEVAHLRKALTAILEISRDRELFVAMGPRGWAVAEQIAKMALDGITEQDIADLRAQLSTLEAKYKELCATVWMEMPAIGFQMKLPEEPTP